MIDATSGWNRRDILRAGVAAGVGLTLGRVPLHALYPLGHARSHATSQLPLITKPIPATGEPLPVVGVGTNRFGIQREEEARPLREVLSMLPELGGSVVDTARVYGSSEEVIGRAVEELGNRDRLFIATKYRTGGAGAAADSRAGLEQAFTRLRTDTIDLMMVHDLGGTRELLPLMRELKQAGRFRYIGMSTSSDSQYEELAAVMRNEPLDVIEIDYSLGNRNAAEAMLPLAHDRGMAVLVNVPFGGRSASVFQDLGNRPLPDWAAEFDAESWAQVVLKWIVSHPAVTATIPGTRSVEHLVDNMAAARGRLPDAAMRRRIEQYHEAL
jgi:aryl-alcohol dehydrogenase-like predicted oxidoreductase